MCIRDSQSPERRAIKFQTSRLESFGYNSDGFSRRLGHKDSGEMAPAKKLSTKDSYGIGRGPFASENTSKYECAKPSKYSSKEILDKLISPPTLSPAKNLGRTSNSSLMQYSYKKGAAESI
eukprot:TRINITY_DN5930_c0_g1_i1.p1 TRINITY_DN5930_c0_g1~~TRINITY_DN5930_c0_g1_i1.p1  ORF type:complete len:140 (+),score=23.29 TRINITY_DN5930_c0_g1_i1:60-422(+)